jgi:coenzyme PQQ precursor peptide PqqA
MKLRTGAPDYYEEISVFKKEKNPLEELCTRNRPKLNRFVRMSSVEAAVDFLNRHVAALASEGSDSAGSHRKEDKGLRHLPWALTIFQSCNKIGSSLMAWKCPKIVEVPVGMEINMYACAARK